MTPTLGALTGLSVTDHPELLGDPVAAALAGWPHAGDAGVAVFLAQCLDGTYRGMPLLDVV